jgi:hypothetical protein
VIGWRHCRRLVEAANSNIYFVSIRSRKEGQWSAMKTEESLKRELARLRKERTALSEQAVQDARSWERINTIGWKTKNVLNQLTEHLPGWKDDEDRIPHRDTDGQINTVRYEAVNAMLHDGFLKQHRKNEEQEAMIAQLRKDFQATIPKLEANITQLQSTVTKQEATTAQQQKGMEVLTATLKEQASQIQKVIDSFELRVSDPLGLSGQQIALSLILAKFLSILLSQLLLLRRQQHILAHILNGYSIRIATYYGQSRASLNRSGAVFHFYLDRLVQCDGVSGWCRIARNGLLGCTFCISLASG